MSRTTPPIELDAFSYGGGVQSTASLVLAAQGEIACNVFLFANVGSDSEHPDTLSYVERVAKPYADAHGLELLELHRGGLNPTLWTRIQRSERSLPLPARMDKTGAPGRRSCTQDYKIDLTRREINRRGATRENPWRLGLGISIDEIQRVRSEYDPRTPTQRRIYPLIELELSRQDCLNVIAAAGLEIPGRSACFFCPFQTLERWRDLRRDRPDLFEKAVELERMLQARRARLGRDPVWLTDAGAKSRLPLDAVVSSEIQMRLEDDPCDGFCHT